MADYPCDWHLARYHGPSHRVYLNIFREEEEIRLKASVCESDLAEIVNEWLTRALHQEADGVWNPGEDDQTLAALWRPTERAAGRFQPARRR